MFDSLAGGSAAPANPLALPTVLERIAAELDASRPSFQPEFVNLREVGMLVPRGQESTAGGAVPSCYFLASACRAAANEAVRAIMVRYIVRRTIVFCALRASCTCCE